MARLSEQLKYFVNKKITEDANWRTCEVVLSGHEVPGEGEHKIMEYIRHAKAQPGYNPNVRHCLYGLDADLIMLGLLSHDPHFCLLREEVKFGPSSKSKGKERDSAEAVRRHSKEQRSSKRRGSESQVATRATSPETQHDTSRTEEPKTTRRRSEDRRQSVERVSLNKPTPPTPASPAARPLERASTTRSVRPTSEMPAADDLNAVRAREAWEMERLFKAKSLTNADEYNSRRISSEASSTPPRPISKDLDAMIAHGDTVVAHGSSHTAFVVQPLQAMGGRRNSASAARSADLPPLASNPLPEPPRESDYKPAPFPVMKLDTNRAPEHWTKLHDGLTTAH